MADLTDEEVVALLSNDEIVFWRAAKSKHQGDKQWADDVVELLRTIAVKSKALKEATGLLEKLGEPGYFDAMTACLNSISDIVGHHDADPGDVDAFGALVARTEATKEAHDAALRERSEMAAKAIQVAHTLEAERKLKEDLAKACAELHEQYDAMKASLEAERNAAVRERDEARTLKVPPPVDEMLMARMEAATERIRAEKAEADLIRVSSDYDHLEDSTSELRAARIAYASEFDGDVGNIHENIRALKAEAEKNAKACAAMRRIIVEAKPSDKIQFSDSTGPFCISYDDRSRARDLDVGREYPSLRVIEMMESALKRIPAPPPRTPAFPHDVSVTVAEATYDAVSKALAALRNERAHEKDKSVCRTCSSTYDSAGDGYDGECPACADKREGRSE
jgi:hypothetical protein